MIEVIKQALMITGFVFVMMLVVEYVNVLTSGAWQARLAKRRWGQYVLAAALGATPGCLGAFAVVAMYSHGVLTVGAVVAAMIATSGDESFVMLAMIPEQALYLMGLLFLFGILVGTSVDAILGRRTTSRPANCEGFTFHPESQCVCLPRGQILRQWQECSAARGILAAGLAMFILGLATGQIGPCRWDWIRLTLIIASGCAFGIVVTVPDHFLDEHLWRHVARKHTPKIFLWTFLALLVVFLLDECLCLDASIREGKWWVLLTACFVGLIPQSGPHLVFLSLYVQGTIPLSVLVTNSIVQDGHGMLPLLAHSKREFVGVKLVNLAVGLLWGGMAMTLGF
jgi:hypothetical protein